MKKGLKIAIILVLVLTIFALTSFCLYRHFVINQIMDGGDGMENPDAVQVLDGDHTYVDNSKLWSTLEGRWKSNENNWQMVLSEDSGITISMDGETVLKGELNFTYTQPGDNYETRLYPDVERLQNADGTTLGEISYLCHEAGKGCGTIQMQVKLQDGTEETIKLQKIKE